MNIGSLIMPTRKPKAQKPDESPHQDDGGTQQTRINADLADKLAIITKKRKTTSAKLLDPIIRPFITELFEQVRREMNEM